MDIMWMFLKWSMTNSEGGLKTDHKHGTSGTSCPLLCPGANSTAACWWMEIQGSTMLVSKFVEDCLGDPVPVKMSHQYMEGVRRVILGSGN
jgi:hypothetical protein